jgi:hypothetical protein
MAAGQIKCIPALAAGLALTSDASAWTPSAWVEVSADMGFAILVLGISYQLQHYVTLDTANQTVFEIGIGAAGSEVTKIQIPISTRADSHVGYIMGSGTIYLPEPYKIASGTRIAVRLASSLTSSAYTGLKIIYQEI